MKLNELRKAVASGLTLFCLYVFGLIVTIFFERWQGNFAVDLLLLILTIFRIAEQLISIPF
jgi:hypothetical protein